MDFIFYLALFFFVLIFGTLDREIDFDFWARLIVGKSYFQTGELFTNDFYSYGTTHEFIDHEWGSSLIFYLIQNNFGDIGLYIFKSIIVFLTLFLITKTIRLEDKNIKFHFLFFFFALHSICYNIFSTIRCQTFSFFFFVLFFYILKYAKTKQNYRILWCLPILNIIWANIHGGFVMGLALIAIFALGEFLNNKKSKFPICLSFCFLASCLTTLINPYGIKYVYFIFEAFKLNRIHITEWQSVFFDKHYIFSMIKFKIFFIITLLFFLISNIARLIKTPIKEYLQKIDKTKYLILLFCILISLKAQRCHVFFTYSVLILCYCDFYRIFNKTLPKFVDNLKEIVLMALLGISCIYKIQQFNFENKVINKDYPIYCVEFIKQNNLKGNVFTMFHTGSYVVYKL
ncbi:MAG: hypothetical protein IJW73_06380, partial [Candidatus Gastranaerophilales bacterium]|nr:hypothetical protein [Candidatus Gastranaerophilales bacterium]